MEAMDHERNDDTIMPIRGTSAFRQTVGSGRSDWYGYQATILTGKQRPRRPRPVTAPTGKVVGVHNNVFRLNLADALDPNALARGKKPKTVQKLAKRRSVEALEAEKARALNQRGELSSFASPPPSASPPAHPPSSPLLVPRAIEDGQNGSKSQGGDHLDLDRTVDWEGGHKEHKVEREEGQDASKEAKEAREEAEETEEYGGYTDEYHGKRKAQEEQYRKQEKESDDAKKVTEKDKATDFRQAAYLNRPATAPAVQGFPGAAAGLAVVPEMAAALAAKARKPASKRVVVNAVRQRIMNRRLRRQGVKRHSMPTGSGHPEKDVMKNLIELMLDENKIAERTKAEELGGESKSAASERRKSAVPAAKRTAVFLHALSSGGNVGGHEGPFPRLSALCARCDYRNVLISRGAMAADIREIASSSAATDLLFFVVVCRLSLIGKSEMRIVASSKGEGGNAVNSFVSASELISGIRQCSSRRVLVVMMGVVDEGDKGKEKQQKKQGPALADYAGKMKELLGDIPHICVLTVPHAEAGTALQSLLWKGLSGEADRESHGFVLAEDLEVFIREAALHHAEKTVGVKGYAYVAKLYGRDKMPVINLAKSLDRSVADTLGKVVHVAERVRAKG